MQKGSIPLVSTALRVDIMSNVPPYAQCLAMEPLLNDGWHIVAPWDITGDMLLKNWKLKRQVVVSTTGKVDEVDFDAQPYDPNNNVWW